METILRLVVYAISAALIFAGAYRAGRCKLRQRQCTASAKGRVADVLEKRSLLSWPNMMRYYPIFEYDTEGVWQVEVSDYPAQHRQEIGQGNGYTIRYDPKKPSRFFAEGWDERNFPMGVGQAVLGCVLLVFTWVFQ